MNTKRSNKSYERVGAIASISVVVLLQVLFIVLKCTNTIDWDWGYILMPLFISGGFYIICTVIDLVTIIIAKKTEPKDDKSGVKTNSSDDSNVKSHNVD